jgi:hypothetical protein
MPNHVNLEQSEHDLSGFKGHDRKDSSQPEALKYFAVWSEVCFQTRRSSNIDSLAPEPVVPGYFWQLEKLAIYLMKAHRPAAAGTLDMIFKVSALYGNFGRDVGAPPSSCRSFPEFFVSASMSKGQSDVAPAAVPFTAHLKTIDHSCSIASIAFHISGNETFRPFRRVNPITRKPFSFEASDLRQPCSRKASLQERRKQRSYIHIYGWTQARSGTVRVEAEENLFKSYCSATCQAQFHYDYGMFSISRRNTTVLCWF